MLELEFLRGIIEPYPWRTGLSYNDNPEALKLFSNRNIKQDQLLVFNFRTRLYNNINRFYISLKDVES